MASVKYPAATDLVMQPVQTAAFSATIGGQYPVDTGLGAVAITMPLNGSAVAGAGVTFTYTRVANVITDIVPAGGTGFPNYMKMAFTGVGAGADATLVSVAGVPVKVVIHNGGTGWTADPTGVTYSVGDTFAIADKAFNFASAPATFKTGLGGHVLSGRPGGEDLDIVQSGNAAQVVVVAPESATKLGGWLMSKS
jgi:hypothetical protein